ncbi:type II toxin-antitoxin system RelE/ParE family toxin [Macrococcus capreoli]
MEREFVYTKMFDKKVKEFDFTDEDLIKLEYELIDNSHLANIIVGTGGLKKIRFDKSNSNKGKSGSYRIFYLDLKDRKIIILITLISKSEQENLDSKQKQEMKKFIDSIKSAY